VCPLARFDRGCGVLDRGALVRAQIDVMQRRKQEQLRPWAVHLVLRARWGVHLVIGGRGGRLIFCLRLGAARYGEYRGYSRIPDRSNGHLHLLVQERYDLEVGLV
jgi:hypothetical protein